MPSALHPYTRKDCISYWMDRAYGALDEANLLADAGFYNTALSRLYFSVYYAVSALTFAESGNARTRTQEDKSEELWRKYIVSGRLAEKFRATYKILLKTRQLADYEDFVYYDHVIYAELRPLEQAFIEAITAMLMES